MQRVGEVESWAGGYNHVAMMSFGLQEISSLTFVQISIINHMRAFTRISQRIPVI
jgi:hypothetical protein